MPPPRWPPRLLIDERKLRQGLLNLLNNAVQFTASGGVRLLVEIAARASSSCRVLLRVQDTGIGFAADAGAQIFEPFYRTGSARRMAERSDLALTIVDRLVNLMGGTITVASTVGAGSEFVVDLNLQMAEPGHGAAVPERRLIVGHAGRARTLLIADDVRESRAVLGDLLYALGFTVVEAANGDEAVALAGTCQPDLIFMDLVMPGLDGVATDRQIRDAAGSNGVPIIALSANACADPQHLSSSNGRNASLSKPIRFEKIYR